MLTIIRYILFYTLISYSTVIIIASYTKFKNNNKLNQVMCVTKKQTLFHQEIYTFFNFQNNLVHFTSKNKNCLTPLYCMFISIIYLSTVDSYKIVDIIMIIFLIVSTTLLIRVLMGCYLISFQFSKKSLIGMILFFITIAVQFFIGFLNEEIINNDFNFTIFIISIYFLITSLFFIIKAASLSKNKGTLILLLIFSYMLIIPFLSYLYIGYGLIHYEMKNDFVHVNVDLNSSFDSLTIFVYYGLWSLTNLPKVIFSTEIFNPENLISIEAIYLSLIGITFTTIYAALILSYISNVLFRKK